MAYNRTYSGNPDALPAHAEPEQAAALMSSQGQRKSSAPGTGSYNKPMPPTPQGYGQRPSGYQSPAPAPAPQQQHVNQQYNNYPPPQHQNSYPPQQQNNYPPQQQNNYPPPQQNNYPPPQQNNYPPPQQNNYPPQQSGRYSSGGSYGPPASGPPPPARNPLASPPPPANYGTGPRPATYHNRPPLGAAQRPPTAPPPPRDANDRDALWPLFCAVDKDRSGQLSESSLRSALVNGDYTAFDAHTVRMMIRMFDADRSGTISFDEFCGLWGFLAAWRNLFDRFDTDRSGNISFQEFSDALVAFGYRLSPQFVQLLFNTFGRDAGGRDPLYYGTREKTLSFDLFVQACISLKRMTDVFKKYDDDRDGYITLSFEEFLTGAQALFLFNSISPVTDTGLY